MPEIIDYSPEFYNQTNFTAVVGGRYCVRTTEGIGLTMTLPNNPGTGAVVEAVYAYGTGSFVIASGGGGNLYTERNPYGTNHQNVGSITFDGDQWVGHHFLCVHDGSNWTISLGLAQPDNVTFREGYLMMSNSNHIYMDASDSTNGSTTGRSYWRTANGNVIGEEYWVRDGYNVRVEGSAHWSLSVGGWGYQSAMSLQTASPPRLYVNGEVSCGSFTNRSDARIKDSEEPLAEGWINALLTLPVRTYMMGDPDLGPTEDHPEGRKNFGRRRHLGFYAQDLLAAAPAAQAEAAAFANQDGILEYDLGSMLSLAILTIQSLNERITALEAALEGGK